jgi:hypothetical protein
MGQESCRDHEHEIPGLNIVYQCRVLLDAPCAICGHDALEEQRGGYRFIGPRVGDVQLCSACLTTFAHISAYFDAKIMLTVDAAQKQHAFDRAHEIAKKEAGPTD